MQGVMQPQYQMQQNQMQQTQESNQWWGLSSQEEYEAYLKWCEERKLAIQEQEQQQAMLKEMEERAKEVARAHQREKAAKEMQEKRESMAAQWRMWKSQLEMADEYEGVLESFMEMKGKYWFKLLNQFLKFCRCTDYASHLQRYLAYGMESYEPSASDLFAIDGFEGVDTTDVEAVARRAASLTQVEQVKLFFGGAIESMCGGMTAYLQQVIAWESQYNFMA
ncbi:uncharacterized protein LOC143282371 [Babylonia areolata]|uniref:uncharacterized protein LOC143282371 n=1 Tax=Babylonia areolata TaxID=304850 RepID=UPI003FD3ADBC